MGGLAALRLPALRCIGPFNKVQVAEVLPSQSRMSWACKTGSAAHDAAAVALSNSCRTSLCVPWKCRVGLVIPHSFRAASLVLSCCVARANEMRSCWHEVVAWSETTEGWHMHRVLIVDCHSGLNCGVSATSHNGFLSLPTWPLRKAMAAAEDSGTARMQYLGAAGVVKLKGLNVAFLDGLAAPRGQGDAGTDAAVLHVGRYNTKVRSGQRR